MPVTRVSIAKSEDCHSLGAGLRACPPAYANDARMNSVVFSALPKGYRVFRTMATTPVPRPSHCHVGLEDLPVRSDLPETATRCAPRAVKVAMWHGLHVSTHFCDTALPTTGFRSIISSPFNSCALFIGQI